MGPRTIVNGRARRDRRAPRRERRGTFVALVAVAFLSFGLIGFRRVVPGWPARSGSVIELGTSRVVGKQGGRGEAKRR